MAKKTDKSKTDKSKTDKSKTDKSKTDKSKTDKFQSDLLRGSLDLMVLAVLDREPQYGYSIQKQIREATNERVAMSPGTLYPLLHRLEGDKLIRSRWDDSTGRRRKWYSLTAAGKKRLSSQANQWNQYAQCMAQLMQGYFKTIIQPTT